MVHLLCSVNYVFGTSWKAFFLLPFSLPSSPLFPLSPFLLWDLWSGSPAFSSSASECLLSAGARVEGLLLFLLFLSGKLGTPELRILSSTPLAGRSTGLLTMWIQKQQLSGLNWEHLQKLTWDFLALGESLWALPATRKEVCLPSILFFFEGDSLHNLHKISHCSGEDDWLIKNT